MEILAYCGYDCGDCPVHQAGRSGDRALQAELAAKYSTGQYRFSPDDMRCEGCLSPTVDDSTMCRDCPMRNCARPKGLATCAACGAYPCAVIEQRLPPGDPGRERLDALAKNV